MMTMRASALALCALGAVGCAELVSAIDAGADVPSDRSCRMATDCADGEVCAFARGCTSPAGRCAREPSNTGGVPPVVYCDCDGVTRSDPRIPLRPYQSEGPCRADADAAPGDDASPDASPDRPCPPGTCHYYPGDPACRAPGGPISGCCRCGEDGECSAPCMCASPDTPIATPEGERPLASLRVGDLVDSVDRGRRVAVPVLRVHRTPVSRHVVVRVTLGNGRLLHVSAGHPTADGRTFGALRAGDRLGGQRVDAVSSVAYAYDATYDVLPASDTGAYFAAGALIGSTLAAVGAPRAAAARRCEPRPSDGEQGAVESGERLTREACRALPGR